MARAMARAAAGERAAAEGAARAGGGGGGRVGREIAGDQGAEIGREAGAEAAAMKAGRRLSDPQSSYMSPLANMSPTAATMCCDPSVFGGAAWPSSGRLAKRITSALIW